MKAHVFTVPKRGLSQAENEDRCAKRNGMLGAFAAGLADGATQGTFSRAWADELASFWAHSHIGEDLDDAVRHGSDAVGIAQSWVGERSAHWQRKRQAAPSGPWWLNASQPQGGFATLLGLYSSGRFDATGRRTLTVMAVGDTNLFVVRDGKVVTRFPLTQDEEFQHDPYLLDMEAKEPPDASNIRMLSLSISGGDILLGLTDALAAWFCRRLDTDEDKGDAAIQLLCEGISGDWGMHELVKSERIAERLKNDDCTILRVHC